MTEKEKDDIYYVCSLIEYIARKTYNQRKTVIKYFSKKDIDHQLYAAQVNHCLPFEQVSDELIEEFGIQTGDYDSEAECRYSVPSVTSIGDVYQILILDTSRNDPAEGILDVFSSFIAEEISDFNSSTYYQNPDYLRCSYLEGELLS